MIGACSIRARPVIRLCVLGVVTLGLLLGTETSAQAAIAFVGASSASTAIAGATTLSLPVPTSVASGNVEIATLSRQGASTITPPSGWTQIIDTSAGSSLRQTSFWHIAGASEAATSWALSASTPATGGIVAYSGVDARTIIDATAQQTGATGTTATVPSLTATYAGDLILGLGSFNNQGTLTKATATTSRFSAKVATTNGPALLGEDVAQPASGASATQAITDSSSTTAWIGVAIGLKDASSTGILTLTTSATPSFVANLNGGDQTPTFTVPLTTTASVSPAPGWNETITSTQFSTGTHTLVTGASTIRAAPTAVCVSAYANCAAATNAVGYPVSVPAGAGPPPAVKFFNAAAATGAGQFTVTPTVTVSVPQNSFAGAYSSTLTLAIVSGP
jgi:hypothetical protein